MNHVDLGLIFERVNHFPDQVLQEAKLALTGLLRIIEKASQSEYLRVILLGWTLLSFLPLSEEVRYVNHFLVILGKLHFYFSKEDGGLLLDLLHLVLEKVA